MIFNKQEKDLLLKGLNDYKFRKIVMDSCEEWFDRLVQNPVLFSGGLNGPSGIIRKDYVKHDQWKIGFGNDWFKSISKLDNKLKGKLWKIISEIEKSPFNVKGNTIKPLVGDFKDLWRYRFQDWRLIYYPDKKFNQILFLYLKPRGSVYN